MILNAYIAIRYHFKSNESIQGEGPASPSHNDPELLDSMCFAILLTDLFA